MFTRDTLIGLTGKERRVWEARALRMLEQARKFQSTVIHEKGVDHRLTDYTDNVVGALEELVMALESPNKRADKT